MTFGLRNGEFVIAIIMAPIPLSPFAQEVSLAAAKIMLDAGVNPYAISAPT